MRVQEAPYVIRGKICKTTESAVLFHQTLQSGGGVTGWVPKSVITAMHRDEAGTSTITLPLWMVRRKGFI